MRDGCSSRLLVVVSVFPSLASAALLQTSAGSINAQPTSAAAASALLGTSWSLLLNVGREESAHAPESWGASGARLPLRLDVSFAELTEDIHCDKDCERELRPYPMCDDAQLLSLHPLDATARFIGVQGEQRVPITVGPACLTRIPYATCSGMYSLRFCLEVAESVKHHDVELPAGQLFFYANAWEREMLSESEAGEAKLKASIRLLQERSESLAEEATSGGVNPLRQLQILGERQQIFETVYGKKMELHGLQRERPDKGHGTILHNGPGSLAIGQSGSLCIRRYRKAPFGWLKVELPFPRVVHDKVGTFTMRPRADVDTHTAGR